MSDKKTVVPPAEFHAADDESTTAKVETVPEGRQKVDHLAEIEQLVSGLHNTSPSGAETIRDQIMERIGAIRDPKAWDARMAAAKKAEDDAEVVRKKAREDAKAASKAEKVA